MAGASRVNARWSVDALVGDAAVLHRRDPSDPPRREVWVLTVGRPALVLGSTQPESDVDAAAAARLGVEVVRRRSGGGAVLLDPGSVVWVDAVVPRDDDLWEDDVGRAFGWLGRTWADALVDLGIERAAISVHEGGLVRAPLSPVVCFAGLGPGEVCVGGAKTVGISQRRTRGATRLQSSALLGWEPERLATLLAPGLRRVVGDEGASMLEGLEVAPLDGFAAARVVDAVVARLPA